MGQIKYLIYACLIGVAGYLSLQFFISIKSVDVFSTKTEELGGYCGTSYLVPEIQNKNGKKLFQQNCQSCHSITQSLFSPALAGVTERGPWKNKENIYKWIKDPAAFIPTTKYTKALKKKYDYEMPGFPQLSKQEIDDIFEYVEEYSKYFQ